MLGRARAAVLAVIMVFGVAPAAATTYFGNRDLGGSLVGALTVTTDGTVGVLGAANILEFSLVLSGLGERAADYGNRVFIGANENSPLVLQGSSLSATSTRLFFDFESGNEVFGVEQTLYLLSSANSLGFTPSLETFELDSEFGGRISRYGIVTLGAVPEPSSWAMLVAGFGLAGAMLRRQRARRIA